MKGIPKNNVADSLKKFQKNGGANKLCVDRKRKLLYPLIKENLLYPIFLGNEVIILRCRKKKLELFGFTIYKKVSIY